MSSAEGWKPGQDTQAVATARLQEQDPDKIHCPAWGVVGNMGDSICYAGVPAKVALGGSTNVVLHAPELARAAGLDFWREVITQDEFNRVSS